MTDTDPKDPNGHPGPLIPGSARHIAPRHLSRLLLVLLLAITIMAAYQFVKYVLFPGQTLVQSNVTTVLFTSAVATALAYFILRAQSLLNIRIAAEGERRREAETRLREANDRLEVRIRERTARIEEANQRLMAEIEEHRRTEEQLMDSEEKYRTLFEETPISITSFGADGKVRFINNFHLKTFARNRYGKDHFIGKSIFDLPAVVQSGIGEALHAVLNGRTVQMNDVFCPAFSGGHSGYMNLRAVPLIRNDRVEGGILIREDVTEQIEAEVEMKRLNRALNTIRAGHSVLVRVQNESDLLVEICRTLVAEGGYRLAWVGLAEENEAKGIRVAAYFGDHRDYLDRLELTWADTERGRGPSGTAIRTGRPVVVRDIRADPDFAPWRAIALKEGFVSALALPLTMERKTIGTLTILSGQDLFDEEEVRLLADMAADLAQGIWTLRLQAERRRQREETQRLQEQLRQAQKMEAIGVLAGGIAHDFNNILGAILGYAQLANLEVEPGSRTRQHLTQVIQACGRATSLVRQILAFSRRSEAELIPLEPGPVVKEALKLLRASLPSTIEIRQEIKSECAAILGDPTQIHQVLMNLCTNAAHAMGENGGRLAVGLDTRDLDDEQARNFLGLKTGSYVRLWVRDTGRGIDPEIMDRIFDPYYTTKAPGEGTGLGLATVHGIIQRHDGVIRVESSPGQGALFEIYLPMLPDAAPPAASPKESLSHGKKERILLVDDEPPLVDVLQQVLTRLGYRVVPFTDSLAAFEAFAADPKGFDLILTDQTMPRMTGLDFAQKALALRPGIPIVLATGFSKMANPETALAKGVRAVLTKPVLVDQLSRTIRQTLDERSSSDGH
jgi:signal transduction histidine kinase/CheY-like chemotaxis protein/PAS domain-containing protein